jgi:hypothetical protein
MSTKKVLNPEEIARQLVDYCRKGQWEKAQRDLYAEDAKSVEPYETPGFSKETIGLENIIEKGHRFDSMTEQLFSIQVSEPLTTHNAIAFIIDMDLKMKGQERMRSVELCVYEIKNGKIVSEQFFF